MTAHHPAFIRDVFVAGLPITQGSKLPGRTQEVRAAELHVWRDAIAWRVKAAGWHRHPLDGPVWLNLRFVFPRLQSAPRRYWAHTKSSGDLDKLVRAVGDALTTSGAYTDDARIVQLAATKHHGDTPGVNISLEPIEEPS